MPFKTTSLLLTRLQVDGFSKSNRLVKFTRWFNEKLQKLDEKSAVVSMRAMPTSINLQTTLKCNYRCFMCIRENIPDKLDARSPCMEKKLLFDIAGQTYPHAAEVALSVSGEPLMADNLFDSLRLASRYGIRYNITTNGSLLGKPGLIDKLLPVLSTMTISLDAATKDTLLKIRPVSNFESIILAIKKLCHKRNLLKGFRPKIFIGVVLMKSNIMEFPLMVRQAKDLGADELHANHLYAFSEEIDERESLLKEPRIYNKYREIAINVARELDFNVGLPDLIPENKIQTHKDRECQGNKRASGPIYCPYSHKAIFVNLDGTVIPCCNHIPKQPIMGNIRKNSVREIWNSPSYKALRKGLRDGEPLEYCRNCAFIADQIRVQGEGFKKY